MDPDEALEEAASVLQRFTDEALQLSLGRNGMGSPSTASSLSTAAGGLVENLPDTEQLQEVQSAARSRDASWGLLGQLTELLQDAEEAAADASLGPAPNILSPESLNHLTRSSTPIPELPGSPEAPSTHQQQPSQFSPQSPTVERLWRLGEAAAADIWTSSYSGTDAHSAASVDIRQPAGENDLDLPACERSQSPQLLRMLQSFPASPEPKAVSPQCVLHEEPRVSATDEVAPPVEAPTELDLLMRWNELIEVPSLSPPSPFLPQKESGEPLEPQASTAERHTGLTCRPH